MCIYAHIYDVCFSELTYMMYVVGNYLYIFLICFLIVWQYDINLNHDDHHHHDEEVPKLEDFFSNSHQTECTPISSHDQTNVNCTTMVNILSPPGYLFHEPTVATPQLSNLNPSLSHDYEGSVSVFKSWLMQGTPTFPVSNTYVSEEGSTSNTSNFSHEDTDYNTSGSTLLLAMSHGAASDLINELNVNVPVKEAVKVDEKRKSLVGKSQVKEPVEPRKSVDSLGQRTSQYRGVTKYVIKLLMTHTYTTFFNFILKNLYDIKM